MRYPNAAKGIKKIYLAEILSIIGAVLAMTMVVLMGAHQIDTNISGEEAAQAVQAARITTPVVVFGVGMMLLMLSNYVLNFIGIATASRDEASFKRAMWVLLAGIAFGIAGAALERSNPQVANWLNVPSTLLELVVTLYVLEGIGNLAGNLGRRDIVDMSAKCRTWLMCALILSAAAEVFVALGTAGSALTTTSGIAAGLLQIVAYVVYLRVLNRARLMQ